MNNQLLVPRPRGLVGVRADANDPAALLGKLNEAFEALKADNDARLKALETGKEDVVTTDKLDRINKEITALTNAMDDANKAMAAIRVGGSAANDNPHALEHATAFDKYFRRGIDAGLAELQVKAELTTQSDPDGGYLVPTETATTIERIQGLTSVMRSLATVLPIGTNEYKKLVNVGGATSGWVGEEESRPTTSTPKLREMLFQVMEIYANPHTTRNMLDDGIVDIAAWLASEVDIEFNEQEGAAFVTGNGVKKPRGFLAYDKVENSSYSWGKTGFVATGAAAGFVAAPNSADALLKLLMALKTGYRQNATFLMNDIVQGTIRLFKDGDGNYIWKPPSDTAEVPTIFGKPVQSDDNMPDLGVNAFPVAVADFARAYLILDRQGVRVLRDELTNKPYVGFYTTKRVGGGIANFEAIKLLKCAA